MSHASAYTVSVGMAAMPPSCSTRAVSCAHLGSNRARSAWIRRTGSLLQRLQRLLRRLEVLALGRELAVLLVGSLRAAVVVLANRLGQEIVSVGKLRVELDGAGERILGARGFLD